MLLSLLDLVISYFDLIFFFSFLFFLQSYNTDIGPQIIPKEFSCYVCCFSQLQIVNITVLTIYEDALDTICACKVSINKHKHCLFFIVSQYIANHTLNMKLSE